MVEPQGSRSSLAGAALLSSLAVIGCHSDSGPETPLFQVSFPGPVALVDGDAVEVRGAAVTVDGNRITGLRIEGQVAQTDDDYATWRASLPLSWSGPRLIDAEVEVAGRWLDVALPLTLEPVTWTGVLASVAAGAGGEMLAASVEPPGVVAIDMAGNRRVVSREALGLGPLWNAPAGIALSANPRFAYVGDGDALLLVDLDTGDRGVFSGSAHAGPTIAHHSRVALAPSGDFLLVLNAPAGEIYVVDVVSGARALVASASVGTGPALTGAVDLAFDAAGAAYVALADAVLALDPTSGARAELSGAGRGTGTAFGALGALGVVAPDLLLAADRGTGEWIAVAISSGDRAAVAALDPGDGSALPGMVVDQAAARASIGVPGVAGAVAALDLTAMTPSQDSGPVLGGGCSWDEGVGGIGVETATGLPLGSGEELLAWTLLDGDPHVMPLTTAYCTQVFGGVVGGYDEWVVDRASVPPVALATLPSVAGPPASALARRGQDVLRLDLATGREEALFTMQQPVVALAIAREAFGVVAAVAETAAGGGDELVVSPPAGASISLPDRRFGPIAFDESGRVMTFELVAPGDVRLVRVDPSGVTNEVTGAGPSFSAPVAMDRWPGQELIVVEQTRVLAVDALGGRRLVSGVEAGGLRGAGPPILSAHGISIDPVRNVLYTVDTVRRALLVIDLESGDRAVAAR